MPAARGGTAFAPNGGSAFALVALTIFLGAFLLFLVQPIVAKLILPRFGGSASVWATCLVFFQAALLAGYAYAHRLVRGGRRWEAAHALALRASLMLLPIAPGAAPASLDPAGQVLALLAASIGVPFVLLATTSPLLQAWSIALHRDPYRLFAVSNLASLGGPGDRSLADRAVAGGRSAGTRMVDRLRAVCARAVCVGLGAPRRGLCGTLGGGVAQRRPAVGKVRGLDHARRCGELRAGGVDQPPDAHHAVVPDGVGAAAGDLPRHLRALLRRRPLVPAAPVCAAGAGRGGRDGPDAAPQPFRARPAAIRERTKPMPASGPQHLWTDGFGNIVAVLRRGRMFAF